MGKYSKSLSTGLRHGPKQDTVFHHTDTRYLPLILESGELQLGRYDPDFLWATTDPDGDRTACVIRAAYQAGHTRLVRFVLDKTDFEPWRKIVKRFPERPDCTPEHIAELIERAQERGQHWAVWYCRPEPLPLTQVIRIDTKAWNTEWEDYGNISCSGRTAEYPTLRLTAFGITAGHSGGGPENHSLLRKMLRLWVRC
jgi:hypothetical protein